MIKLIMKKIFLNGLMIFLFTALIPKTALAQTKAKTVIKLPTFMAGEVQMVDKNVDGDLMIAGKQVKITADINGDAYVAGQDIEISGNVNGDLIVAGMNVTILGKVQKNLIMAGGQVVVSDSAKIGGYALTGGNKVNLSGNFAGPVRLGGETLIIGQKTVINGSLEADVVKSEIATESKITGEKNIRIHEINKVEKRNFGFEKISYIGKFVSFLSKLIVLFVLVRLFGKKIVQVDIKESFWSAIGLGLVVLIVTPILGIILLGTVIAAPLSVLILIIYFVTLYFSTMVTSILVGKLVSEKANFKSNIYAQGAIGLLLVTLLGLIPVLGGLTKIIVFLVGLGIIFKGFKRYFSKSVTN